MANALQRKANRNDIEQISKMMMSLSKWTGNDTDRLEDAKNMIEQEVDKKISNQHNSLEDGIRKQLNKDLNRINAELLNLNTVLTKVSAESKKNEEGLTARLSHLETKVRD